VLLSVPAGTEKGYTIQVQRRSAPPEDILLEERIFTIYIDKQLPQKPSITGSTEEGQSYSVAIECEPNTVLEGVYYTSGVITSIDRNDGVSSLLKNLHAPLSLIVWAVDEAGNCSEPVSFSAERGDFSVINPVPGTWQNMQPLVIENHGTGALYWTDDGSDPFGPTAQLYEKPVLIQKTGTIQLRLGMKLPNGLRYEKKVTYKIEGNGDDPFNIPEQIQTTSVLNVDGEYQWAIEPGPWLDKRIAIQLVPLGSYRRFVCLLLKTSRGIYRYPIVLDGKVTENKVLAEIEPTSVAVITNNIPEAVKDPEHSQASLQEPAEDKEPVLMTSGPLRVLFWKNNDIGIIRYHVTPERLWKDYTGPILVPKESFTFEWIVDKGLAQEGPIQRTFKTLDYEVSSSRGVIHYRSLYPEPGEVHTLGTCNGNEVPAFAACTGEDLEWTILSAEGKQLVLQRTDALPPPEPMVSAPSEGAWVSGAVHIESTLPMPEEGLKTFIQATLSYPSGKIEQRQAEGVLNIDVPQESPVAVSITSFATDAAGNKGPAVSRSFTIDANSVYVSSRGSPDGDGSRNRPVTSLEQALELAKQLGRSSIRIQDSVLIEKPLAIVPGLTIENASNDQQGEIRLLKDGMLLVESGMVRIGRLSVKSDFKGSPAIEVRGGNLELTNTNIVMKGTDLRAIVCTGGNIQVSNATITLDAQESGIALWGKDCSIFLKTTTLAVKASKYAVGVEQRRGTLVQDGGSVVVAAQDGTIWLFSDMQHAQIQQVQATLESNFVAQACVVEGMIPQVANSTIYFKGDARQASVFTFLTGEGVMQRKAQPGPIISGNYFIGFNSLVHAQDHSIDLKTFNRTFAAPATPNFVDEDP
jgi:hypothetical protein